MFLPISPSLGRKAAAFFLIIGLTAGGILASLYRQKQVLLQGSEPLTAPPVFHAETELGVNVSLEQYSPEERLTQLAAIKSLGIDHIKQTFFFTPGFDWGAADAILTDVQNAGLEAVVLLDGNPDNGFAPPSDINDYAMWAGEFAARHGEQVDTYFIWDEPNIASHWGSEPINPDVYGALLTAAAAKIRQNDPTSLIAAAPLAPTVETTGINMAEPLFLQALYENGAAEAFDIVAARPFGFEFPPEDSTTSLERLNFSRVILLRQVMVTNGDAHKPVWAGNWGWNALPEGWTGSPSIWETVSPEEQIDFLVTGLSRGRTQWPWMGRMYWHHWDPDAPSSDPVQGFSMQHNRFFEAIPALNRSSNPDFAQTGFHPARPNSPYYDWHGDWEFSPDFGADMSQKAEGEPPDTFTFRFVGTDVGLRVRRANYRARFYVLVDGQPANALPLDETSLERGWGSALVLNTNDPNSDYIAVEPVATDLPLGQHTVTVTAFRGWDQYALNGVAVRAFPNSAFDRYKTWLWGVIGLAMVGALFFGGRGQWGQAPIIQKVARSLNRGGLLLLTVLASFIVILSGWLTWNTPEAGLFRRLDDFSQLGIVFGTAAIFYVTPWVIIYAAALVALANLLRHRPAWGLALAAFTFPFYVPQVLKPVAAYRFSPVEIFTLLVFAIAAAHAARRWSLTWRARPRVAVRPRPADVAAALFTLAATLSLFFTDRLDVATNEWRTVILGPFLFYVSWRLIGPTRVETRWVLHAFLAGGTLVALIGLGQFFTGTNLITAEAGIPRLRSIYGSPNNVALYLGRQLPLLLGLIFLGLPAKSRGGVPQFWNSRAGRWWSVALIIQVLAFVLTLSKGGLLLSLPVSFSAVFVLWQRLYSRPAWRWVALGGVVGVVGYFALLQVPGIGPRLDFRSATGILRLNLWRSSIAMWADHFWWGVGLDNFLYDYRSRYILARAWQEPNLNHPHNLFFDLATRLGVFGLMTGLWLFAQPWLLLRQAWRQLPTGPSFARGTAAGLVGGLAAMVAHGLVDHSFFLIDLAFTFYLFLAVAVSLRKYLDDP